VIPSDARVILVADGEFDGVDYQKTANLWGWKYVSRTGKTIALSTEENEFCFDDKSFELGTWNEWLLSAPFLALGPRTVGMRKDLIKRMSYTTGYTRREAFHRCRIAKGDHHHSA
jgi:hypothetical protein